jgi:hypothetical protein
MNVNMSFQGTHEIIWEISANGPPERELLFFWAESIIEFYNLNVWWLIRGLERDTRTPMLIVM